MVFAAIYSGPEGEPPPAKKRGRPCTKPKYPKKKSTTDPDATMATGHKKVRLEPSYKQHTAVDDHAGVVVDVELTTGEAAEGGRLVEAVERVEETTGIKVERVTGDAAYAHPTNYEKLEQRGTDAIMPPSRASYRRRAIPLFRFTYDGKHKTVRCPGGKFMHRSGRGKNGWRYRAKVSACKACALRKRCIPPSAQMRTVCIVDGYEALLRARRRKGRGWDEEARQWYRRHRWRVEGVHGEGKTQHGLRRAARRGLDNVAMQVYLTAAVMNLKRLAALLRLFWQVWRSISRALGRSDGVWAYSWIIQGPTGKPALASAMAA